MNFLRAAQRRRRRWPPRAYGRPSGHQVHAAPATHPGSRRTAQGLRWTVLAAAIALVLTGSGADVLSGPGAKGVGMDRPGWGFTHTQFSADHGSAPAVAAVQQALAGQPMAQNQHIMGWGANNPEPAPGVYRFDSLDSRIDFIRATGGTPVITLCCAPDWMKGGTPGKTDWDRLTEAPLPEHYADFAALSAVIARRYPDVRHFMVWNEFKGFFDEENDRWDAEAYTELYNQVYEAVKAVNPHNRIGGPYIDMARPPSGTTGRASPLRGSWGTVDQRALDAFDYWLAHKRGADFVVIDGHATAREGGPDEFAALEKLSAVSQWVGARTELPLWWAEWYVDPADSGGSGQQQRAVRTAAMIEMAKSGVDTALYWNPRPGGEDCATCLWTDTADEGGGRSLPFLTTLRNFARWFPPGTRLEEIPSPAAVHALAQPRMLVAVNTLDSPVTVSIDGRDVRLAPYETRWITRDGA
ncbi:MAG: GH39 family glycosyl hydrolase [Pseudonocardiaceae bacterium]